MKTIGRPLAPTVIGLALAALLLLGAGCRLPLSVAPSEASPGPAGDEDWPLHLPTILRAAAPVSDTRPLTGSVLINDGMCCAGGTVGQTITLQVALTATSPFNTVTHMRVRGQGGGCPDESGLAAEPWTPFQTALTLPYQIQAVNWVGHYFGAQFRDALGNLSPAVCDDISIEGMPLPP